MKNLIAKQNAQDFSGGDPWDQRSIWGENLGRFCFMGGVPMEREELLKEVFPFRPGVSDSFKRDHLLSGYKWSVSNVYSLRKRLKKGINTRTGKPYKPITLKGYKRELKRWENRMYKQKLAINMLSGEGYFGNKRNVISLESYRNIKQNLTCQCLNLPLRQ